MMRLLNRYFEYFTLLFSTQWFKHVPLNIELFFQLFVRDFLEPLYTRYNDLSFVPAEITAARFKLLVDSWACTYQVHPCLEQSYNLLMQWYNTTDPDNNNP